MFVTQKTSGCNMILKTMKYVTPMTYRWALGWGKHPFEVLSYLYQKMCACWELRLAEIGLYTDHKCVSGCHWWNSLGAVTRDVGLAW